MRHRTKTTGQKERRPGERVKRRVWRLRQGIRLSGVEQPKSWRKNPGNLPASGTGVFYEFALHMSY